MPTKDGPQVRRISGSSTKSAYDKGYDWCSEHFKKLRTKSVAIAVPFSRQTYPAQKALAARKLSAKVAIGASPGAAGPGVYLTTFHQLKGLEFDHVVLLGLHDAQFPGRLLGSTPDEDLKTEEDMLAQLTYMAMTRAKGSVTLVRSSPFCRFFSSVNPSHIDDF